MKKLDQQRKKKAEEDKEKRERALEEQLAFYEKKAGELSSEQDRGTAEVVNSSGEEFIK